METREIVVGLESSAASAAALRWAADEAVRRGSSLRVVHSWQLPSGDELASGPAYREVTAADARARATRWLGEALGAPGTRAGWVLDIVEGPPGPVLVDRARDAAMLVVGTGDHVGLRRVVEGSVSHYCLSHATCPVVAVPAPAGEKAKGSKGRREAVSTPGPLL